MADYRVITECRACKSSNLFEYLDLNESPLANKLDSITSYPIKVVVCEDCYLSQLSIVVRPEVLYSEYPYHSSMSSTFKTHCADLAQKLKEDFSPSENPLVIDIASNDGTCLAQFRDAGFERFLGVEPSNLAHTCIKNGFPCTKAFWSEELARSYSWEPGAAFIVAQNVLAHVDNLRDFILGVKYALHDKGVFVGEFPYMIDLVRDVQVDTIYHEHLSYFLLNPLHNLFSSLGLPIFKIERLDIHGGSLRIYASKDAYSRDESVMDLLKLEGELGYYKLSTYIDFAARAYGLGARLQKQLEALAGSKIMGYGASAKGISLINYFALGKYFHSIVDETPAKQGHAIPGSLIPIVPFTAFDTERPDYIFLLAPNFSNEMKAKTSYLGAKYLSR